MFSCDRYYHSVAEHKEKKWKLRLWGRNLDKRENMASYLNISAIELS